MRGAPPLSPPHRAARAQVSKALGVDCSDVEFDEARSSAQADAKRAARLRALLGATLGLTAVVAALRAGRR